MADAQDYDSSPSLLCGQPDAWNGQKAAKARRLRREQGFESPPAVNGNTPAEARRSPRLKTKVNSPKRIDFNQPIGSPTQLPSPPREIVTTSQILEKTTEVIKKSKESAKVSKPNKSKTRKFVY